MNVLAIIPARGGSKGIPRKNIELLGGKPLVAHTISHAQNASEIDNLVVTSDDKEIRDVAASFGAPVVDRPDEFAHDKTLQEVDKLLIWTTKEFEKNTNVNYDIIVLLYPTAPLRDIESINKAVRLVKSGEYDSVLSVYHDTRYLWKKTGDNDDETVIPSNYDPCNRMPRQKEMWNQWAENKAIYVMRKDVLFEKTCRMGDKIGMVEMEKWRSVDIDTPVDLLMARSLYDTQIKNK
ncbi:acylneuraminate cytidylyltransferase family protein [Bernardetia sp. MNP-M8]|uniref:acylneuraminate cytidylyltransferase family protein n=1 Tax=Bernardetia sp. MNP-M8 TaxID=3127470 RepID=UPI0030CBEB3B